MCDNNSSKTDKTREFSHASNESEIFSTILSRIGGRGKWQWIIFCVASYSGTALALGNLSAAFIAGVPDYWCNIPEANGNNTALNVTLPLPTCEYYISNKTITAEAPDSKTLLNGTGQSVEGVQCTSWEYDDKLYHNTIVTEWNLVCDDRWKRSTAQSIFMVGVLLGGCFLSELSDVYGRKCTVLLSTVFSIISTFVVVMARDYGTFVGLRFISAIFVTGVFLPSFVLCMEIIDSRSRTFMGMLFQVPFSIGLLLLPGLAYFIKSWRYFQLSIAVFTSFLILNFWFIPESPRWLLRKGRNDEALEILKKGARINGNATYDESNLETLVRFINPDGYQFSKKSPKDHIVEFFTTMFKLVKTPIIRRRSLITFYQWFVVATVYYGLTLASKNFQTSPHVMLTISGVADIVGLLAAMFILFKFGRRNTLAAAYILSGAACICILLIPLEFKWVIISLATIGKTTNSVAFCVIFIYSAELMPTPIRTIALGVAAVFARTGSAVVPYIVDILVEVNPIIPPTIFGVTSLAAGCLTFLLPETANKPLPETIEELEKLKK